MNAPEFQQVIDSINRAVERIADTSRSGTSGRETVGEDAFKKDLDKQNAEKLADVLPKLDKHLNPENIPTIQYFDTAFEKLSDNFTDTITTQFQLLAGKQESGMEDQLKEQKRANELEDMRKIKKQIMPVSVMEFDKKALKQLAGLLKNFGSGRSGMGMGMGAGTGVGVAGGEGGGLLPWILGGLGLTAAARALRNRGRGNKGQDPGKAKVNRNHRKALDKAEVARVKAETARIKAEAELKNAKINEAAAEKKLEEAKKKQVTAETKAKAANDKISELNDQKLREVNAQKERVFNAEAEVAATKEKLAKAQAENQKKIEKFQDKIHNTEKLSKAETAKLDGDIAKLQAENTTLRNKTTEVTKQIDQNRLKWEAEEKKLRSQFDKKLSTATDTAYKKGLEGKRSAAETTEAKNNAKAATEKSRTIADTAKEVALQEKKSLSVVERLNAETAKLTKSKVSRIATAPLRAAGKIPGVTPLARGVGKTLAVATPVFWGFGTGNREAQLDVMSEDGSTPIEDFFTGSYAGWEEVINDPTRVDPGTLRPAWEDKLYDMAGGSNQTGTMWHDFDFSKNFVPGYSGSPADKITGIFTGAGMGAMEGALIGGVLSAPFGGGGAIPGAVIGGAIGGTAEIIKLYTDPILKQRKKFAGMAYDDTEKFFESIYSGPDGLLELTDKEIHGFTDAMKKYDTYHGGNKLADISNKRQNQMEKLFASKWTASEKAEAMITGSRVDRADKGGYVKNMKDYWSTYGAYNKDTGEWNREQMIDSIEYYEDLENFGGEGHEDDQISAQRALGNTAAQSTFQAERKETGSTALYETLAKKPSAKFFGVTLPISNGRISDIPPEHYRMFREMWVNIESMSKTKGRGHYAHLWSVFNSLDLPGALRSSEMGYIDNIQERIKNDDGYTDQQGTIEKILHGQSQHGLSLDKLITDDSYSIKSADGKTVRAVDGLRSEAWKMKAYQTMKNFKADTGAIMSVPAGGQGIMELDGTRSGTQSGFSEDASGNFVGKFYDADANYMSAFMKTLRNDQEYQDIIHKLSESGETDNIPVWGTGTSGDRSLTELRIKKDSPMAGYIAKRWTEGFGGDVTTSGAEGLSKYRGLNEQIKNMLAGTAWQWNDGETKVGWENRLAGMGIGHKRNQLSWELMPYTESGYKHLQGLPMSKSQIISAFQIKRPDDLGHKTIQQILGTATSQLSDNAYPGTSWQSLGERTTNRNLTQKYRRLAASSSNFGQPGSTFGNFPGAYTSGHSPLSNFRSSMFGGLAVKTNTLAENRMTYVVSSTGKVHAVPNTSRYTPNPQALYNIPGNEVNTSNFEEVEAFWASRGTSLDQFSRIPGSIQQENTLKSLVGSMQARVGMNTDDPSARWPSSFPLARYPTPSPQPSSGTPGIDGKLVVLIDPEQLEQLKQKQPGETVVTVNIPPNHSDVKEIQLQRARVVFKNQTGD